VIGIEALEGVWTVVPTPFADAGSLDVPSLRTLTDWVVERGVNGMTILGVMGEASKISDAERTAVIETVIGQANGRIPVCVGVSHAATDRAVAFAREAVAAGAHSVMLAPPALARPNEAALRRHYFAVAESIDRPIVVQDHPASSGVWMTPEFLASLASESTKCRVVKLEEEPSPPKVERLLKANPEVRVLGGLGAMMLLEELRRGAAGTMTGFGFPEILVDIVARWRRADVDGATEVFYRYAPLIRFENQPLLGLPIRKHIYQRRGAIASARVRAPAAALDPGTITELDDLLTRLGLATGAAAAR
jgi:4-hydroxy-tetrahydrodipicolinate synthase